MARYSTHSGDHLGNYFKEIEAQINNATNLMLQLAKERLAYDNVMGQASNVTQERRQIIKDAMERYCVLQNNANVFTDYYKERKQNLDELPVDFGKQLSEKYARCSKDVKSGKDSKFYKRLLQLMGETNISSSNSTKNSSADDSAQLDCVMTEQATKTVPIDPLTKQSITDPVRNNNCNHTYERSSIIQHLRLRGGSARCPMVGCASAVPITLDVLEDDDEMWALIQKKEPVKYLLD